MPLLAYRLAWHADTRADRQAGIYVGTYGTAFDITCVSAYTATFHVLVYARVRPHIRRKEMTENTTTINRPRPRTAAQVMGIKAPALPQEQPPVARPMTPAHAQHHVQNQPSVARTVAPPHAKMKALSEKAHAISLDERDARRTRVLTYLQQVRIATRRDIDRVAGYRAGVSHDVILETLYRNRLIDRIDNIDSGQTLYAITARGAQFAIAPSPVPPLTTFEWQNMAQQEHTLGIAAFASIWFQKTPLDEATFQDELRAGVLSGDYVLIGEALMQERYAKKFGKKTLPDTRLLDALYMQPEPTYDEASIVYAQAWWYMIPPYIQGRDAARIDMVSEDGTPSSQQELTGTLMRRHPADAVLAPIGMERGKAIALEVERYAKPASEYESTMRRYGSTFGCARFGEVIWACANQHIFNLIINAAEKTGTTDMVGAFIYDTGRHGSFIRGTEFREAE